MTRPAAKPRAETHPVASTRAVTRSAAKPGAVSRIIVKPRAAPAAIQRATLTPPCACGRLRRATRALTQLYDDAMAPSGMRITQFSMIRTLMRDGPVRISELAAQLLLDRTALSRTLEPLVARGWVDRVDVPPRRSDIAGIQRRLERQREEHDGGPHGDRQRRDPERDQRRSAAGQRHANSQPEHARHADAVTAVAAIAALANSVEPRPRPELIRPSRTTISRSA
jgi:hypothetical protein